MKKPKISVASYVAEWVDRIKDPMLSCGEHICSAYAFSVDIHAKISAGLITDAEVYGVLRRHIRETPSRNLIRLHTVPESVITRAAEHVVSKRAGISYSHLLYSTKLPMQTQVELLNRSMDEGWTFRTFQSRANAFTSDGSIRPICFGKQFDKTAEQLVNQLVYLDDGFIDSLNRVDPLYRSTALVTLRSATKHLEQMQKKLVKCCETLVAAEAHLRRLGFPT